MKQRSEHLLQLIVEHYIATGQPVGSKFLVEKAGLDVSGATVRNEMRQLEEDGYLTHPHTSAGRIPTEAGYRHYIAQSMKVHSPSKKVQQALASQRQELGLKGVAKLVAAQTNCAVIVAFGQERVYYTGISYLFAQPEFRDYAQTLNVSSVFDHCEEHLDALFSSVETTEPSVLVGKDNPLGAACSLVGARIEQNNLFAVLGPIRMDYGRTVGLLQELS